MGKRRNADKKSYGAASSINYGGGGSSNSKFSAFDFNDDDTRVEDESRKAVAKFGAKSPSKKPVYSRKSIDKYDFLECFAKGIKGKQKHFGNDVLDVDATDGFSPDRTFGIDVGMSFGSLNYEPKPLSSLEGQSSERTCGEKSSLAMRKPECRTAGKNHNKILHLDSDEDERSELGSLGSSINIRGNEGSLEEQSSEYGANSSDCEAVVVVVPYYVKYGNICYTRCQLIFSQRCVRLEGSALCDRKKTLSVEWSTFDILNIEHQQYESANAEVINLYLRCKGVNADETGNSNLCYPEFEDKDACEQAYFKMDNALIDDRRIHVDFSQSVAKLWSQYKGKGRMGGGGGCFKCGSLDHIAKDCTGDPTTRQPHSKYMLKDDNSQRGGDGNARYEMVFEEDDDGGPRHSKRRRDHKAEQSDEKQQSKQRDAYKPRYEDEKRRDTHDWQIRHERSKGREDESYAQRQMNRGGAKDYMDRNDSSDGRKTDASFQNSRDERERRRRHGSEDDHKHRRDHREHESIHGDDAGHGYKRDGRKYDKKLADDDGHRDRKSESEAKKKSGNEDLRESHRARDDNYGHKRRGEERHSDKRSSRGDDYCDRVRRH